MAEQGADQRVTRNIRQEAEHQRKKVYYYDRRFEGEAKKCTKSFIFDKENKEGSH